MAFGFIKKVFSFGNKEVVEEKIDEQTPLPPIDWGSLEALKAGPPPVAEEQHAQFESRPEPEASAETQPAEPPAEPLPGVPEPVPPVEPVPAPVEPEPQPSPEEPAPAPMPAEPAPPPVEIPVPPVEPSQEPQPAVPQEIPSEPAEVPEAPPVEIPPAGSHFETQPASLDVNRDESATANGRVIVAKAVEKRAEPERAPEPTARPTWFQRLKQGLSRSSKELSSNIAGVFTKRKLDEDTLQDLEDVLIRADLGMETAIRVTDALASGRYGKDVSEAEVRAIMAQEVEKVLTPVALPLELDLSHKPHVVLVVGVNGTGKTTTIGKLSAKLVAGGLSVTLAAGDTFRAAAIEQLKIWGERTGSPVVASKLGADAAGLAYDAFQKAKEAGSDVLIIDTAGRLQNKAELMAELEKIVRVLGKLDPEAPHTVLQTVDATTGQNALNQVEIFRNIAGVNGLVMTKLDGTARGGILVAIAAKHRLPVYFIGVGEQVDDLEPFSAGDFAKAIAGVA
jgi:fused signal recognition particle receptor